MNQRPYVSTKFSREKNRQRKLKWRSKIENIQQERNYSKMYREKVKQQIADLENEVQTLKRKYSTLKQENEQIKMENVELRQSLEKTKKELFELEEVNLDLRSELDKKTNQETKPYHENVVDRIERRPYPFQKMVKLNLEQFKNVHSAIVPIMENLTTAGVPRQRARYGEPTISFRTMLFLTLFWLRHYPTDEVLSAFFNLDKRQITRAISTTLQVLAQALDSKVQWPSDMEMEQLAKKFAGMHNGKFPGLCCVIDGTEIKISRPSSSQYQQGLYSKKKKQFSVNVLIICDLVGNILYVSPHQDGAHDQAHWNKLDLRRLFENKSFGIAGDGGFYFNRQCDPIKIIGYTPFKKPKHGVLNENQKLFNRQLSEIRVIVENVTSKLKDWKVLRGTYRHYSKIKLNAIDLDLVVKVVAALTQFLIAKKPLRNEFWKPKSHPMSILNIVNRKTE
jgi:regulator of replication initiation timing